jgi:hypothetical protein
MENASTMPTLLVIDMKYTLYERSNVLRRPDLLVKMEKLDLVSACEDGAYVATSFIVSNDDDAPFSVEEQILDFIYRNFGTGVVPTLVSRSMCDLVRYLDQNASHVMNVLQDGSRVDIDTLMRMVPPKGMLAGSVPTRESNPNAIDTLEAYLYFKEVFSLAEATPPLAPWELGLLNFNNGQSTRRVKSRQDVDA